jgi:riboflavin-specific deaminase-like protein
MFIFSNLATSLDGKIATAEKGFFPLGTPEDRRRMQVLRQNCDAILMGASTLRTFQKPCIVRGQKKQPINLILSRNLEGISPEWDFFTSKKIERILFINESTPIQRIKKFSTHSEIILLKPDTTRHPTALQMIQQLKARKIGRLLVEGGGGVMWDFVRHNLIEEYHITLTPKILGGTEAPTLVDGPGFLPKDVLSLKLKSCEIIQDEIYLIYQRKR